MVGDAAFQIYLRQLRRYPLLSEAQEKALGRRLQNQAADHVDAMAAREELILSNLRLVVTIARRYQGRGLALPDLVEEGNIGLVYAVERYDPRFDARFATYAAWWIRQAVRRALITKAQAVRLPTSLVEELNRWRGFARGFERDHGRFPTEEECAERFASSASRRRMLYRLLQGTPENRASVSLDLLFEEQLEGVADPRAERPDLLEFFSWERDDLARALEALPERQAAIVRLRYGLDATEPPLPFHQIGARLGLSRERARQLEREALERLRLALGQGK